MLHEEVMKICPTHIRYTFWMLFGVYVATVIISVLLHLIGEGHYGILNAAFPILIIPVLFVVLATTKMSVSLTSDSLTIKNGWGAKRVVPVSSIRDARIEAYDSNKARMWKYGFNIRYGDARSYIAGDVMRGLWIELYNGEPFMVSSETPEQFESALRTAMKIE
ncbi:MAG: hypothetical protein LBH69_05040 [Methanomassiliicoccaceae archaeon]|jgi:hypothetical protein|nr:hypothetical protein [Methanomassiliicoccaceae archaeon]